jgi:hypothetical protein
MPVDENVIKQRHIVRGSGIQLAALPTGRKERDGKSEKRRAGIMLGLVIKACDLF